MNTRGCRKGPGQTCAGGPAAGRGTGLGTPDSDLGAPLRDQRRGSRRHGLRALAVECSGAQSSHQGVPRGVNLGPPRWAPSQERQAGDTRTRPASVTGPQELCGFTYMTTEQPAGGFSRGCPVGLPVTPEAGLVSAAIRAALPARSEAGRSLARSLEGHGSHAPPLPSPQPAPRAARPTRSARRPTAPGGAGRARPSPLAAACPGNSHHAQLPVLSTSAAPPGPDRPPASFPGSRRPLRVERRDARAPRHLTARGRFARPAPPRPASRCRAADRARSGSQVPRDPRRAPFAPGPAGARAPSNP